MKNLLAITIVPFMLLTGCALFDGNTDASKRVITSTKVAAFVGTSEYVRSHPESRVAFEKAAAELEAFENTETLDAATLIAIVHRLPVKELKSERAAIYITAATIIFEDWAEQIPIDRISELKPVAKAIREGIQLGLQ